MAPIGVSAFLAGKCSPMPPRCSSREQRRTSGRSNLDGLAWALHHALDRIATNHDLARRVGRVRTSPVGGASRLISSLPVCGSPRCGREDSKSGAARADARARPTSGASKGQEENRDRGEDEQQAERDPQQTEFFHAFSGERLTECVNEDRCRTSIVNGVTGARIAFTVRHSLTCLPAHCGRANRVFASTAASCNSRASAESIAETGDGNPTTERPAIC